LIQVSVIIVGWNHKIHLRKCLESLFKLTVIVPEVIYVDNASEDGSVQMVHSNFPLVKVIANQKNEGFCKGNNQGIHIAQGEYIFILNPDTQVHQFCISKLTSFLKANDHVGLCGPKILHQLKSDTINSLGMTLDSKGRKFHIGDGAKDTSKFNGGKVPFISGAGLFFRKILFERIGGLDENLFAYADDTEFSLRVWHAGMECHIVHDAIIYHYRHAGAKTSKAYVNKARYYSIRNHFYPYWVYFPLPGLYKIIPYIIKYRLHFIVKGIIKLIYFRKENPELKASFDSIKLWKMAIRNRRKLKLSQVMYENLFLIKK
jgi:GT2 family glycosyltransferase